MSAQRTDMAVIQAHKKREAVHRELRKFVGRKSRKRIAELVAIAASLGVRRRVG